MKNLLKTLFPSAMWTSTACGYALIVFLKIMLFNVLWGLQTTFTAFSYPETYINTLLATFILVSPYMLVRNNRLQILVLLLLDVQLVCNIMYSRTYNAIIPLTSYSLAGNLSDFLPSVVDSMRWVDLAFPLSTLGMIIFRSTKGKEGQKTRRFHRRYWTYLATFFVVSLILVIKKGGLTKAINQNQDANHYTCVVPMYTIWGNILYQSLQEEATLTPQMRKEIHTWLNERPAYKPLPDSIRAKQNLVIVLCESLESWVINRTIEGKQLTPNLNNALKDSSTLYAPKVLTQVRGGRSIDCQLLLNAGMLPIESGCYAVQYPNNHFYSLTKALNEKEKSHSWIMTVDKAVTWNQEMIAKAFGIEHLLCKPDWKLDEAIGSRKKLGDVSFMKQATQKMKLGEVWKVGSKGFVQLVTYSGHNPFVLPKALQRITLKGEYPQKMLDYMLMANYTDHALGILLNYLKTRPDYKNTMIVITGDHEGLAADRATIRQTAIGKAIVSPHQYTPFIVINSPVGGVYNEVMGQIDMYPTILNLMHLDHYKWKGMGQSILDPSKAPIAVGSNRNVEGNVKGVSAREINRLKNAYKISDWLIRYNLLP